MWGPYPLDFPLDPRSEEVPKPGNGGVYYHGFRTLQPGGECRVAVRFIGFTAADRDYSISHYTDRVGAVYIHVELHPHLYSMFCRGRAGERIVGSQRMRHIVGMIEVIFESYY